MGRILWALLAGTLRGFGWLVAALLYRILRAATFCEKRAIE
jgi:hypothetical protein